MKKLIISCLLPILAACTDEQQETPLSLNGGEVEVTLHIAPEDVEAIQTRTWDPSDPAGPETDRKINQVVVYAFSEDGTERLGSPVSVELNHPDTKVHMILPAGKPLLLHAVCNSEDPLFNDPGSENNVNNVAQLETKLIKISRPEEVFRGSMMMHGFTAVTADQLTEKNKSIVIPVHRLGAHVEFDIRFNPKNPNDRFFLSQIKVHNLPARSWLVRQENPADYPSLAPSEGVIEFPSTKQEACPGNVKDATYNPDDEVMSKNYLGDYRLQVTESSSAPTDIPNPGPNFMRYATEFYQFENRRGQIDNNPLWFSRLLDSDQKKQMQQIFKREYGDAYFKHGTYATIEGTYITSYSDSKNPKQTSSETSEVKYTVYLGHTNDTDFNIKRNGYYKYTVTILTCEELDTRVDIKNMSDPVITPGFSTPLDAHCNVGRCLAYSKHAWELYVENPDQCPWLELSMSRHYQPLPLGMDPATDREHKYAVTRMSGTETLTGYFYIHTDEYVPPKESEDENLKDELLRRGTIVLRDKENGKLVRFEVTQRPAQLVRLPKKDLLGNPTGEYHEFYVEHTLEEKYLSWGFLKYPANPIMTSMINDRLDGLSNTRKLYNEAVKRGGMYNPDTDPSLDVDNSKDPSEIHVPHEIALGYAVDKNRDRDGNGRIDQDEIVWYVPALDELAELRRVLNENHLEFESTDEKFWSSTPYLAGYTEEIPGRAFYVKMGKGGTVGEKAFAMRNRYYNVICCRRKGAWTGNDDSGAGGGVGVDDGWNQDEEEIMPIK